MGMRAPSIPAIIRFSVTVFGTGAILRLYASIATAEFPKRSMALKDKVAFACSGTMKNMCHVAFVELYTSGTVKT